MTSVVVNLSSDPEHVEESICSLKFGERMVRVKNRATMVSGTSMSAEMEMLERQLKNARFQLQEMKEKGLCAHFGPNSSQTEINSITENIRRLKVYEKKSWDLQVQKTELEGAHIQPNDPALQDTIAKLLDANKEMSNIRDIIARQKSIKGLWIDATPAYERKEALVAALETNLRQLCA